MIDVFLKTVKLIERDIDEKYEDYMLQLINEIEKIYVKEDIDWALKFDSLSFKQKVSMGHFLLKIYEYYRMRETFAHLNTVEKMYIERECEEANNKKNMRLEKMKCKKQR